MPDPCSPSPTAYPRPCRPRRSCAAGSRPPPGPAASTWRGTPGRGRAGPR
ncbi:hypothetical protein [Ornithinimicrobium kibberense]